MIMRILGRSKSALGIINPSDGKIKPLVPDSLYWPENMGEWAFDAQGVRHNIKWGVLH